MSHPIVGIGELLWDVYLDGRKVAGGAPFNFAFHCHQLGHEAVIVSRVGDDALGRELRDEVRRLGLSDEYIQTDREHPTGTVTVALDANKVPTYTITENVAWDYIDFRSNLDSLATEAEAVCFGSLAQRSEMSRETIQSFIHDSKGIRIFDINLRQPDPDRLMLQKGMIGSEWIKVNEEELIRLSLMFGIPARRLGHAMFVVSNVMPVVWITTRGERGVELYLHLAEEPYFEEGGVPAKVVDTVGAGDAFTAAMICMRLEGRSLRNCARIATRYAARVCEHQGATPRIDRAEVERAL